MDPSLTKNNADEMTAPTKRNDREGVDLLVSGLLAQMAVPEKPRRASRRPAGPASRAKAVHVAEAAPVTIPAPARAYVDDSSAFEMMLPYDYD